MSHRSGTPRNRSGCPSGKPCADMVLSHSLASRVTEDLWEDFEAFALRDLSALDVVYLFLDAVCESPRRQAGPKEGIL